MTEEKKGVNEATDFRYILEGLDAELSALDEHSTIIMEKTTRLKDYRSPKPDIIGDKKSEITNGIVDELKVKLERFSELNNRLNEIKQGLIKLV